MNFSATADVDDSSGLPESSPNSTEIGERCNQAIFVSGREQALGYQALYIREKPDLLGTRRLQLFIPVLLPSHR